jgi:hypothetical protein
MQLLFNANGQYSLQNIILNLLLSFTLGIIIASVYKKTHRGLSYSQSFLLTLVMLSVVGSALIMIIGNSLARAFAVFGGFSIVRFRSAIKDTKDIAYVFFSLVMGMAVGTQNYLIGIIGTLFVCLIILLLTKYNFGSIKKHEYILNFITSGKRRSEENYLRLFEEYLRDKELLNATSPEGKRWLELSYNIKFYDDYQLTDFMRRLKKIGGIKMIDLISSKRDIEY